MSEIPLLFVSGEEAMLPGGGGGDEDVERRDGRAGDGEGKEGGREESLEEEEKVLSEVRKGLESMVALGEEGQGSFELDRACAVVAKRVAVLGRTVEHVSLALRPFDAVHLLGSAISPSISTFSPSLISGDRWLGAVGGDEELAKSLLPPGSALPWGRASSRAPRTPTLLSPQNRWFGKALSRVEEAAAELLMQCGRCGARAAVPDGTVAFLVPIPSSTAPPPWQDAGKHAILAAKIRHVALQRLWRCVEDAVRRGEEEEGGGGDLEMGKVAFGKAFRDAGAPRALSLLNARSQPPTDTSAASAVRGVVDGVWEGGGWVVFESDPAAGAIRWAPGSSGRARGKAKVLVSCSGLEMALGSLLSSSSHNSHHSTSIAATAAAAAASRLGLSELAPLASTSVESVEALGEVVAPLGGSRGDLGDGEGWEGAEKVLEKAAAAVWKSRLKIARKQAEEELERLRGTVPEQCVAAAVAVARAAADAATTLREACSVVLQRSELPRAPVLVRQERVVLEEFCLSTLHAFLRPLVRGCRSLRDLAEASEALRSAPDVALAGVSGVVRDEVRLAIAEATQRAAADAAERGLLRAYEELVDGAKEERGGSEDLQEILRYPTILTPTPHSPTPTPTTTPPVFPAVQLTLSGLASAYRCVADASFRALARDAIGACVERLQLASSSLVSKPAVSLPPPASLREGVEAACLRGSGLQEGYAALRLPRAIDAQLFLVSQLLYLREQMGPFHSALTKPLEHRSVDFTPTFDSISHVLSSPFSLLQPTAAADLAMRALPHVSTHRLDPLSDLDTLLRTACERLVRAIVHLLTEPLLPLLQKSSDGSEGGEEREEERVLGMAATSALAQVSPAEQASLALEMRRKWASLLPLLRWRIALHLSPAAHRVLFKPTRAALVQYLTAWRVAARVRAPAASSAPDPVQDTVAALASALDASDVFEVQPGEVWKSEEEGGRGGRGEGGEGGE